MKMGLRIACMVMLAALLVQGAAIAGEDTLRMRAEQAVSRALAAMASRQWSGGWGAAYSQSGNVMWGEYKAISTQWITIQPPATPSVAGVFLRAAQITRDETFAHHARLARLALERIQTAEGGFPQEGPVNQQRTAKGTFDDDTTTAAVRFLVDWWRYTGADEDRKLVERAGEFILISQYASGGWPQAHPPNPKAYERHITFNDGNMVNIIRTSLLLHGVLGDARYLEAARRAGECIIRLQGGPGEAIWAQQYDPETLEPAWARKFEPPGYSSAESVDVCDVLIDLYLYTGEERFLQPLPKAFDWYDTHVLPNGKRARLYEPGTQLPVYGRRDKAEPVYDFADACSGYSWQADWYPRAAKAAYERIAVAGRDACREERQKNRPEKSAEELTPAVEAICADLSVEGWWLADPNDSERTDYAEAGIVTPEPVIRCGTFVRNAGVLLDYLEAVRSAGQ